MSDTPLTSRSRRPLEVGRLRKVLVCSPASPTGG